MRGFASPAGQWQEDRYSLGGACFLMMRSMRFLSSVLILPCDVRPRDIQHSPTNLIRLGVVKPRKRVNISASVFMGLAVGLL